MEAHHHTNTPRKKWTHYFWEFLMLFLAVFCGFLAEYQLEHVIENNREKQFMRSMVEDLANDTSLYNFVARVRKSRENSCDSLILLLKSDDRNKHTSDIYFHAAHITINNRFQYNDRTVRQLLNSGSMRLIRKKGASDSILNYDKQVHWVKIFEEVGIESLNSYKSYAGFVFDAAGLKSKFGEGRDEVNRIQISLGLLTEDPIIINQLCTLALFYRKENHNIMREVANLKVMASRLILFLKNKYDIN